MLLALGGLGVDVALVAEDGLACGGIDAGEFVGHDAAAVVVEGDLRVVDEILRTGHGSDSDASGFGLVGVVDPLAVVVEILAELFFEDGVGGEDGVGFEEGVGLAGGGVDADAGDGKGVGLGGEEVFHAAEPRAVCGEVAADSGEVHGLAGLAEILGENLVACPIKGVDVATEHAGLAELVHLGGDRCR